MADATVGNLPTPGIDTLPSPPEGGRVSPVCKTGLTDSIVASVIESFKSRSAVGIAKYGTTLDRTDLGILDWIQHAQEELMDGILYLEKLKKTLTSVTHQ